METKIIKRLSYEDKTSIRKKNYPYSIGNEPVKLLDKHIPITIKEEDIIQYPDMKRLYEKVSEVFRIPMDNFIITNGSETALRIALTVSKILFSITHKDEEPVFCYEYPSWDMVPIVGQQCGFFLGKNMFKSKLNICVNEKSKNIDDLISNMTTFMDDDDLYNTCVGIGSNFPRICYSNRFINNIMSSDNKMDSSRDTIQIVDNTYIRNSSRFLTYNNFGIYSEYDSNVVMNITSLSKLFGCGLRIAILTFSTDIIENILQSAPDDSPYKGLSPIELFSLFREQYINTTAYNFFVKGYVDRLRPIKDKTADNTLIKRWDDKEVFLFDNDYYRSIYKFIKKPKSEVYSYDWDTMIPNIFEKEIKPLLKEKDLVYNKHVVIPIKYRKVQKEKYSHVIIYRLGYNMID